MGDGILALFGYPRAHEDDAERAVRAGLDIAAMMKTLPALGGASGAEPLAARVGIATGSWSSATLSVRAQPRRKRW